MIPAARVQAAIEILDLVIAAAREAGPAADTVIASYFKTRRYAGSKDRRAVRDLVYRAIRRAGERPASGRAALLGLASEDVALKDLFTGEGHAPAMIGEGEALAPAGLAPAWLMERLSASLSPKEMTGLLDRAPLDLRVNRLKADRDAVLAAFPDAQPTPFSPDGLRFAEAFPVEDHPLYRDGSVEVQDEGSQLIARACKAEPGMTVVDLCAGAGGKTLALAAAMAMQIQGRLEGRLVACDTDRARLARLAPRAARAGATGIEQRLLDPGREGAALADLAGMADVVLVDAPCSGSGTWRRNPESRWRLTPERLERLTALQARLLSVAATLVKPGGRLVYAVCSLLGEEGGGQIEAFLAGHPGWRVEDPGIAAGRPAGSGRLLTPASDHTDGFFIASLSSPC